MTGTPPADSAGIPWQGRRLTPQPFAGDDGRPDPGLVAALAAVDAGDGTLADVVAALGPARLLVPLVAVVGDEHPLPTHQRGDLGADLALVTLTLRDQRRVLPVFSSVETLTRWDPAARPVPVESGRAAQAAVAEDCEDLLLDAAGPVALTVPRPAVWALGAGRPWTPPALDGELRAALEAAVRPVPDVHRLDLEPYGDAGVRVEIYVTAGLSRAELDAVVHAVRALVSEVELVAERVNALQLRVLPA